MSVKKSLTFLLLLIPSLSLAFSFFKPRPTFTIMIDPAGDAHHPGRKIEDTVERTITLQCAHAIKAQLEQKYPRVRVLLTRSVGDDIEPLQNAQYANRADINCYMSIHSYQEKKSQPQLFLYYFSYGNDFIVRTPELALYEYDQAHLISLPTTHQWTSFMRQVLEMPRYKQCCDFNGLQKLPLKPLIGIKAPAFAFELGIKNKEGWIPCIEPILASLETIIKAQ